ncbi:MAG: hypothetical protein ACLFQG_01280 [Desulfovermiculus sp.]
MSEVYISQSYARSFGYCAFCCLWDKRKKKCSGLPEYLGLSSDKCVHDTSSRAAIISRVTGRKCNGDTCG